jgi:hypothetical protein
VGHSGEIRSVHEFLAKIARLAFSKGAAFCYAVTVGVSGQLAYNYLQPRDTAPKSVSIATPARNPAPPSGNAVVTRIPGPLLSEPAPLPATLASVSAVAAKPAAAPRAATAPILSEPPSLSLPSPAALPTPALKPAALPPSRPALVTPVESPAAPVEPAQKPAALVTATPAPLPDMQPPHDRAAEMPRAAGNLDTAVAAPIPLLPLAGAAEVEKAAIPIRPGPGSGGLY